MHRAWLPWLAGVLALAGRAGPATAQITEARVGLIGSYGAADVYGPGLGVTGQMTFGERFQAGLRFQYFAGGGPVTRSSLAGCCATVDVGARTTAWLGTVDLGVRLRTGPVRIVPGLSLGAVRFWQHRNLHLIPGDPNHFDVTLFVAPVLTLEIPIGRMRVMPEVAWALGARPSLATPVAYRGLVGSLRLTYPLDGARTTVSTGRTKDSPR